MTITSSTPAPSTPTAHFASPRDIQTRKSGDKSASEDSYHPPESRRSAGRPPEGQKLLNTLLHPFAPEKRRRRRSKTAARAMVREAIDMVYAGNTQKSQELLREFIRHCTASRLDKENELLRGRTSSLHPLEEILRAGDYDSLMVLAHALKAGKYGAVFLNRSDSGFYVGEGIMEGTSETAVFKARGHGILMYEGQRTEGEWRNNLPNGHIRHFPKDGPLRCYDGQVTNSKMHGKGRAEYADGSVLRGTWVNNVREGKGEITWANGDCLHDATWAGGVLAPGAILDTADGRRFEGNFDQDTCRPQGECAITWQTGPQTGARYEGPVQEGVPSGTGEYMFGAQEELFGFAYEGPFFKGTKHGVGRLIELHTEKKTRCHYANDVLKTPPPEGTPRYDFDSDDEENNG